MRRPLREYEVVRVIAIHDDRFALTLDLDERSPVIGDIGTIVEAYTAPEPAFEVECSDPTTGTTIWLRAMYPEELESVEGVGQ